TSAARRLRSAPSSRCRALLTCGAWPPEHDSPPRYRGGMTTFDLRTLRIRSGDQARERVEIELEPLVLGGQTHEPMPNPASAELAVTRASSGTVLELAF